MIHNEYENINHDHSSEHVYILNQTVVSDTVIQPNVLVTNNFDAKKI